MNEKISYLNVFFQHDKDRLPFFKTEDLVDHLPALTFVYDTERRRILFGNRKFIEFTGSFLPHFATAGMALSHLLHPDDFLCIDNLLDSLERQDIGRCNVRLSDSNGDYVIHQLQANVLKRNDNGHVQLIFFVAQDITDALKSKEEIETTTELLDETEELLQFGSWAWDISTNVVTWTSGLYTLLGYTRQEVAGKIGFDFYLSHLLDEYVQPFQDIIQNSLREKKDFACEYELRTHSGQMKTISTKGRLVTDDQGDVAKILCINRDITALRSFEKEQERNIRELNRSNKDLEEFAYIASHDLQEPLRKISMFTERLKAKYDNTLDKEGEMFIDRILASAANMRILIDNLLEFSRANRRSNTFDQVNIKAILDRVISELELKIEETGASIMMSGSFPTVEAVTSEMAQLFANILSNAIKFRRTDVPTEIHVHASRLNKSDRHTLGLPVGGTFYRIDVQDNGIGFEQEYSEKIFQLFQRLNGKSEYPGSGIGLAICKKIVEKHNGLIFADSQPERGATFTIVLPEKQF